MGKEVVYPADTVDASGKVWGSVGENIRNGSKTLAGDTQLEKVANFYTELLGVKCYAEKCVISFNGSNGLTVSEGFNCSGSTIWKPGRSFITFYPMTYTPSNNFIGFFTLRYRPSGAVGIASFGTDYLAYTGTVSLIVVYHAN